MNRRLITIEWPYWPVSGLLLAALIINLCRIISLDICHYDINNWGYTEFLINYQGGFIRRGLLGELLFQFSRFSGVSPVTVIMVISLTVYAIVLAYYLRKIHASGACWWIVLSPLFLGFVDELVRKDFILYALLTVMIMLVRKPQVSVRRIAAATVIAVISLMLHEAFMFWGIPLFILLVTVGNRNKESRKWGVVSAIVIFVVFMLLCYCNGTRTASNHIIGSWNTLLSGAPLDYDGYNSIMSLRWGVADTVRMHWEYNFPTLGACILRALFLLASYYLVTRLPGIFMSAKDREEATSTLSILYIASIVFLLPMFLFLSCDYARIYQYASVAVFSVWLNVSSSRVQSIFPASVVRLNSILVRKTDTMLPPRRWLLILLLLLLAASPSHYDPIWALKTGAAGTIFDTFTNIFANVTFY